jgi:hypothetical protein
MNKLNTILGQLLSLVSQQFRFQNENHKKCGFYETKIRPK